MATTYERSYSTAPRNGVKPITGPAAGNFDAARSPTPATAQEAAAVEAVRARALRYLTRLGLADGPDSVAAILGLTTPGKPRRQAAVLNGRSGSMKQCAECGEEFTPHSVRQRTCSMQCGRVSSTRKLRDARAARAAAKAAVAESTAGGA